MERAKAKRLEKEKAEAEAKAAAEWVTYQHHDILFLERQFDLHAMLMILLHAGRAAEKKIADEREMAAAEWVQFCSPFSLWSRFA